MSATTVDATTSLEVGELVYNFYDQNKVEEVIEYWSTSDTAEIPVFNLKKAQDQKKAFDLILKKLTNEIEEMPEIEIRFEE